MGLQACKPTSTPMVSNLKLLAQESLPHLISNSLLLVTQIRPLAQILENQSLDSQYSLALLLFHGDQRRNLLYADPPSRKITRLSHQWYMKHNGYFTSLKIYITSANPVSLYCWVYGSIRTFVVRLYIHHCLTLSFQSWTCMIYIA